VAELIKSKVQSTVQVPDSRVKGPESKVLGLGGVGTWGRTAFILSGREDRVQWSTTEVQNIFTAPPIVGRVVWDVRGREEMSRNWMIGDELVWGVVWY
jgi:hypothetical protein